MDAPQIDVIIFDKASTSDQETFEIKQKNAVIVRNHSESHMSSSKIKLKNIVDYKWELKPYVGRLVAAHKGGNIIAYAIKGKCHFIHFVAVNSCSLLICIFKIHESIINIDFMFPKLN